MLLYDILATTELDDAHAQRKRLDAAKLKGKRMAYDLLAGNGLLDRPIAHNAMDIIERWNGKGWVTVPCGLNRTLTITTTHLKGATP